MMEDLARIPCVQDFSNHLETHTTHTDRQTDRETRHTFTEWVVVEVGFAPVTGETIKRGSTITLTSLLIT